MSLSIAGVFMLLGIPFEVYAAFTLYPFPMPEFVCILRHMLCECGSYASALTVTAFSVDRFLAVRTPVHMFLAAKRVRVIRICAAVWMFSIVAAAAFSAQFGVLYITVPSANCTIRGSAFCTLHSSRELKHSFEASSILFFLIPGITILVLHVLIIIRLRASRSVVASMSNSIQTVKGTSFASITGRSSLGAGPVGKSLGAYFRSEQGPSISASCRLSHIGEQHHPVLYSPQANRNKFAVDTHSKLISKSSDKSTIRDNSFKQTTQNLELRSRLSVPARVCGSNEYLDHVLAFQPCRLQENIKRHPACSSSLTPPPMKKGLTLFNIANSTEITNVPRSTIAQSSNETQTQRKTLSCEPESPIAKRLNERIQPKRLKTAIDRRVQSANRVLGVTFKL